MGPYLGTPNTEKDSEDGKNATVRFGACSMQGWRKTQEDSHIACLDLPDGAMIFGVFDGHGGEEVSIYVERYFVEELKKLEEFKSKNYEKCLSTLFRRIDELLLSPEGQQKLKEINSQSKNKQNDAFMMPNREESIANFTGCTATVCLVTKDKFYCANAGDSRTVLARKGKPLVALSEDHKPDNPEEKARIEAAGGYVEENRVLGSLNLSRSLGDFEYKNKKDLDFKQQMVTCDPEIRVVERDPSDEILILACDGIWDCLSSEECVQTVRENLAKANKSKGLVSKVIEEMFDKIIATDIMSSAGVGTDNMTCVVVEFLQNKK